MNKRQFEKMRQEWTSFPAVVDLCQTLEKAWKKNDQLATRITATETENARLRDALNEVMPRYVELYEAAGLGDPNESVAMQIARAALAGATGEQHNDHEAE